MRNTASISCSIRWTLAITVMTSVAVSLQTGSFAAPGAASQGPYLSPTPVQSAGLQEQVARMEYEFSLGDDGQWSAPNRANDIRSRIDGLGIELTSRTRGGDEASGGWRLRLALTGWGRGGVLQAVEPGLASADMDRVHLDRGALEEWYVNDGKGLEQGFMIAAPPEKADPKGPLVLEMAVSGGLGATLSQDGRAVTFTTGKGAAVLRYADLVVVDAKGAELVSRLTLAPARLRIEIEDGDAVYPLTVDPLMTTPAWTAEGDQVGALFGEMVATAGDVNGDGFSDVIVGAGAYDNGQGDEGWAFLYLGSSSGLSILPAWTAEGNLPGSYFGISVATAGDVNGDGYADVIVGAKNYTNGQAGEGRAFVYHGSASGLALMPSWTAESDQAFAEFGRTVSSAGDVNADGYADVIVGAQLYDNGQIHEGRAYVYLGSASGLALIPSWTAEGDQDNAHFGNAVASAGDVNGDGYADVIVGAIEYDNGQNYEGRAFVYHGSASGLALSPSWTAESDQASAAFGFSVASAGDVNGDGYADVIVGTFNWNRVFVYLGSVSGLAPAFSWTAEGDQSFAFFGHSVASAGDVNGDGYADVIVGADGYSNGQTREGRAFVYHGTASGLALSPSWTAESDQVDAFFGSSVAAAGDVNGDGYSDVIAGADWYDNGETDEGRAFLYLGSAGALAASPAWTASGTQSFECFGCSVASAGDVNGDGFSDVIVGAPYFDRAFTDEGLALVYLGSASGLAGFPAWTDWGNQEGANLGFSVAGAGDVNGDGYSDVIVGADRFDFTTTLDAGQAFVYLGSSGGLGTRPSWTSDAKRRMGGRLGASVASAGDVNGDGYGDVILGALDDYELNVGEGRAFVHMGSSQGLAPKPHWAATGDQSGAHLGGSVATAGDVNQDGYSDVVVGATGFANGQPGEGRALVYLGSANGPSASPVWTVEGNQGNCYLGGSVAPAGDINGDGYSDVIIGSFAYDNGEVDEGRAFVYLGSATGPSVTPAWTAEGNRYDAFFGASVASAGDVNADGFSDVIVGAPSDPAGDGWASVYLGSAIGLAAAPAWGPVGIGQAYASYGNPVAGVGDVDGDGFSDVVAGAGAFDVTGFRDGKIFVYLGNGSGGVDRVLSQAREDRTAPISLLGMSDSPRGFRVAARGRSPQGRDRIRLQWEIKALGVPFDGTGLEQTAILDTGAPAAGIGSAISFNQSTRNLRVGTPYHWRARTISSSPFFPRSPWFSIPGNGSTETDLRTSTCVDNDRDGYGSPGNAACLAGGQTDCDDSIAAVYPGAPEVCDGRNNNCLDPSWPSLAPEIDNDGDGLSECQGDCDDAVAATHPAAAEINDALDNNCPGDLGYGVSDEITGGSYFSTTAGLQICWNPQQGATLYEVARYTNPQLSGTCQISFTVTDSCYTDPDIPPSSTVYYYIVRAAAPNVGSWGVNSNGTPRSIICN